MDAASSTSETTPASIEDLDLTDPAVFANRPSPEQRAEYVIMRLEQFIREGRTIAEGMSFRKWQMMAKTEIAVTIAEAENSVQKDDPVTRRLLFMTAACLTTIGFWGTAFALDKTPYLITGLICAGAGLTLLWVVGEWRFRKWKRRKDARLRVERLSRIEDLNRRIKRLERELEREEKALNRKLKKTQKARYKSLGTMPPTPQEFV